MFFSIIFFISIIFSAWLLVGYGTGEDLFSMFFFIIFFISIIFSACLLVKIVPYSFGGGEDVL